MRRSEHVGSSWPAHAAQSLGMAFGYRHSEINRDVNSLYDMISGVTPTLTSYEKAGSGEFFHRSAFVSLQDLALAATVCSPMTYEVTEDDNLYFILPFHGQAKARSHHKDYCSSPMHGGVLMPGHARKGCMSEISMLQATLKPERFKRTAMTMTGHHHQRQIHDRLQAPQLLAMQAGPVRFDHLFSTICQTIDDCALVAGALNALGFNDLFYRSVVSMAFPELFADPEPSSRMGASATLDRVCDYIDAHLSQTIYLTELEEISQLSTRSLQYAFQRRFGCTPMAWIRERRLQLAHKRLRCALPGDMVIHIAMECGFSNPGDFARLYFKRFGELPGYTLSQSVG
jgi:AraC-like DNA-binding protein